MGHCGAMVDLTNYKDNFQADLYHPNSYAILMKKSWNRRFFRGVEGKQHNQHISLLIGFIQHQDVS